MNFYLSMAEREIVLADPSIGHPVHIAEALSSQLHCTIVVSCYTAPRQ